VTGGKKGGSRGTPDPTKGIETASMTLKQNSKINSRGTPDPTKGIETLIGSPAS